MNLSQVLLEGRKDDFLRKFKGKFSPEQIKKVFMLSRDLSPNQKFLMFLGDAIDIENFDENLSKAQKAVEKFIQYQQALEQKDINQYKSLDDIINAINQHENKVRRKVKEVDGADVVYEDDQYTVVTPKTHKASCYYGAGTKWCTASRNGSSHFDNYNVDGKLFYIVDKKAKSNDRFYKVALLQKYIGDKTFYDAPDKTFSEGWILGTPKWDEIQMVIDEYIQTNFKREIEIFKDKEKARLERERIRKQREAERRARRLADAQSRKENDEWNIDGDLDEQGEKANAVFEVLQDYGADVDEESGESIYNLVPGEYSHYNLDTFEWLGEDYSNTTWAVGDWNQVYEAAQEYYQDIWNDMGIEGWNKDFIMSYIDEGEIQRYLEDLFEYDVEQNPEVYFDDNLPLADWQEKEVEKLEEEMEEMEEIVHYEESTEEEIDDANERIEEIMNEIEEIKDNPQGEPTVGMIDDMVESLVYDKMQNLESTIEEYDIDISEYIDVDQLVTDAIDMDGTGQALSSYDGSENEAQINGTYYFVYRVD